MSKTFTSDKIYDTIGNGRYMYVECTQVQNGSAANTSTIYWKLIVDGDAAINYTTGPTTLKIAGANRYYSDRVGYDKNIFPAKAGTKEGNFTVNHKEDGSIDEIEVSLTTAIWGGAAQSTTVSGKWQLDKISRYFTSKPSVSFQSRTETSLTLNWSTSEECSGIEWSGYKNGAKVSTAGLPGKSGTVTFSGLDANKTYSIKGVFTRRDSSLKTESTAANYTTYNWPYLKSISVGTLKIGSSQTVTFYNPLGRTVNLYMSQNSASTSNPLYTTGKFNPGTGENVSYTFTPNADRLYSSIPSATSGTAAYFCNYEYETGQFKNIQTLSGRYEILNNNAEKPTFSADYISFKDAASSVTNITGQNTPGGWLVQSLSNLQITITNAGTPQKGATSNLTYEVTFGGVKKNLSVGTAQNWGTFNIAGTQAISVKVIDSRGLSRTVTKNVTFKEYRAPIVTISATRSNVDNSGATNAKSDVDLAISYSAASVNSTNKIKVKWAGIGQEGYVEGSSNGFSSTLTGNKNATATGALISTTYTFTATITDQFGKTSQATATVTPVEPIMFIDTAYTGVGVNCIPQGKGLYVKDNLQINGKRLLQKFDMDLSDLNRYMFYPVVFKATNQRIDCEIYSPQKREAELMNQNSISFSLVSRGWTDAPRLLTVHHYGAYDPNEKETVDNEERNTGITIGCIARGNRNGNNCVWLRGGLNYIFCSNVIPTLYPDPDNPFTNSDGEVYAAGATNQGDPSKNTNIAIIFEPQATLLRGTFFSNSVVIGEDLTVRKTLTATTLSTNQLSPSSGTLTSNGNISFADSGNTAGAWKGIWGWTGTNDSWAIRGSQSGSNSGYLEIATGDDGTEPIYVRQYGLSSSVQVQNATLGSNCRTLTLLNSQGNTEVPGTLFKRGAKVPAVFVQSSQPTGTEAGDIWFVT